MSKPAGVFLQFLGLGAVIIAAAKGMDGNMAGAIFYGISAVALLYWGRQPLRDAKRQNKA